SSIRSQTGAGWHGADRLEAHRGVDAVLEWRAAQLRGTVALRVRGWAERRLPRAQPDGPDQPVRCGILRHSPRPVSARDRDRGNRTSLALSTPYNCTQLLGYCFKHLNRSFSNSQLFTRYISTRLFFARPAASVFGAMGCVLPNPCILVFALDKSPRAKNQSATVLARCSDKPM